MHLQVMNVSDCYSYSSQSMDEALSGRQWDIHWGQSSGGASGFPQNAMYSVTTGDMPICAKLYIPFSQIHSHM